MIGFVTVGTNDMPRALAFYDALLAVLGARRLSDQGRFVAWGTKPSSPMLALVTPFDEKPATVGNGVMIALSVDSREQVDEIHAKALALGGTDEGAVGLRGQSFYAGYFRDLDGNKFCAFKNG